ncbi:MAG: ATP-binding cassette domain-containing protein [Cyclobacteriaceae bacterium]|nr:ATP-binding cassette domain-containing protein [Cyclobacteriaceae bacterium]
MANFLVETQDLTHCFGTETVVNSINLNVPAQSIYGFLGPNGAGKTTTLKLILGLLRKQTGEVTVLQKSITSHRVEILKKIGSLIESPSLYGHLSAYENLKVWQPIYNTSTPRLHEVLNLVGLHTGAKKVSKFSLGMKQRLGIAVALLHEPMLLVLDEPTNGLDPNGIIEMRELLRTLNQQHGITIIVSSHLLAEIEKLVTDVGVINKGKLMFQGTLPALMTLQQQAPVMLETSDNNRARILLSQEGITAQLVNGNLLLPALSREQLAGINRMLVLEAINVYCMAPRQNDLETVFMEMIKQTA